MSDINTVVAFVRSFNEANNNAGCPRGHMKFVGGFVDKLIDLAHESGALVNSRGKGGGSWPAGMKPDAKTDNTPSVTAKAFDMLLALSRGETVSASDARALWEEREALNAARRKE